MCEFCKNIHDIEIDGEPKAKDCKFPFREKLILVKEDKKYRFYGFNKYAYEDDACYQNVEVEYCPKCGRKLSEVYYKDHISNSQKIEFKVENGVTKVYINGSFIRDVLNVNVTGSEKEMPRVTLDILCPNLYIDGKEIVRDGEWMSSQIFDIK